MAQWSVKPEWKKSIIERQHMRKDDNEIIIETGWRWGEFIVYTDDDNPPKIEAGVDIYNCEYETELVELNDGCWEEHDFDDCDDETREWLEEFLEENSYLDLEEHGWIMDDCEMIIDCDLIIEKIADTEDTEDTEDTQTVSTETKAAWPFNSPSETVEYAKFVCTNCDYSTEDIMDLVDNPNDDDNGAYLCPECNNKVELK